MLAAAPEAARSVVLPLAKRPEPPAPLVERFTAGQADDAGNADGAIDRKRSPSRERTR
jgi:hypothetical protein